MKRSTISFALTLVMAIGFAVSCGKDSKGGSGGGVGTSLITAGGVSQTTAQATQDFNTWYNGSESYTAGQGCGNVKLTRVTSAAGSSNSNCSEKSFLGIKFYVCSSNYNSTNNSGTSAESNVYVNCSSSVRSSYGNLSSLVGSGPIIEAYSSQSMSGSKIYTLRFKVSETSVVTHVIDTGFPASFQPMHSTYSDGSVMNLTKYQVLGTY